MTATAWKSIAAVVIDPFRSEHLAIDKAAELAARSGAQLTLLNVFMIPQPTPEAVLGSRTQIIKSATAQRLQRLRELATEHTRRGIKVNCVVEWDYPIHEAIVRHVLKERPDLLVAEAHRHSKLARWVLANTDWELIRACPCPVWFARSKTLPAAPRIRVAVDPFHANEKPARLDDRLLKTAQGLTQQFGGTIDLVHAFQQPVDADARNKAGRSRMTAELQRRKADIEARIANLALRHDVDMNQCLLREGSPVDVLGSVTARGRTDVLVMGAVSRSFHDRSVIGNTAERVIDHIDCDVLVVKPSGFKSPVARARPRMGRD